MKLFKYLSALMCIIFFVPALPFLVSNLFYKYLQKKYKKLPPLLSDL